MQIGSSFSAEKVLLHASEKNEKINASTFPESDNVAIRDRIETYLTSPDKADQTKTWAAHRASGYADFFAQPDFRDMVEKYATGVSADDGVWNSWPGNKRLAFAEVTSPMVFEKINRHGVEHAERLRASGHIVNSSGIPVGRPFNAEEIGRDFERETESGMIDFLKRVDEHEQAGTSGTTWETAFRSRVTTLDHHFDLMRRAYSAHKQDATEITKRYEQVLGDLYDYAVERDKQRKASSAPSL